MITVKLLSHDLGLKYLDVLTNFQMSLAKETENLELNREILQAGILAVLKDSNLGNYYIAIDSSEKVVGMLLTMNEWSDWRCSNVMWIHSVYIDESFRKQGIFSKFFSTLKDKVQNDDSLSGIRLYVDKTNLSAINVYKSLGMSDDHYKLFEWLKD